MQTLIVTKSDLLAAVKESRAKHAEEVEKAEELYLRARFEETKEWAMLLKDGKAPPRCSKITQPESHLDSYDELIAQLEWETRDEIELSARDFSRYVLDKWEWKGEFDLQLASSAGYLAGR